MEDDQQAWEVAGRGFFCWRIPLMADRVSRRHFIGGAVASAVAAERAVAGGAHKLPTRVLGRTGVEVTVLAQG